MSIYHDVDSQLGSILISDGYLPLNFSYTTPFSHSKVNPKRFKFWKGTIKMASPASGMSRVTWPHQAAFQIKVVPFISDKITNLRQSH